MDTVLIVLFFYIIIGLILYYGQENWVKDNDREFYDNIDFGNYLKYFLYSVLFWLPHLIRYWMSKNKEEDEI